MFINEENGKYGLIYISKRTNKKYELLEGIDSKGFTSDIIFILDRNDIEKQKVVNFIYGGFDNIQKDGIEFYIEDYEKQEMEKNEN